MPNIRAFLTNSKNLFVILIIVTVIFVFMAVIFILRNITGGGAAQDVTLNVWGVFDTPEQFQEMNKGFESANRGIKIKYTKFSYEDYERKVIDAFAAGTGPDIWFVHNTWTSKHLNKMLAMPEGFPQPDGIPMTEKEFKVQFVEAAYNDMVVDGKIYSLPPYVDTLAMYYNRDLFNTAGITKPAVTWDEFNTQVERLTKFDASGNIVQAGAAIGSAKNINRSTDILMAMMIQSGVQMILPESKKVAFSQSVNGVPVGDIALQYYTDFTNPAKRTYCWNENQHYSIDAFAEGAVAMMFNYSHQIDLLRSKNPRLNFAIAPMPQANPADSRTYASYWAPAVASNTKYPAQAWTFLQYLGSAQGAKGYLLATKRPSGRRDLIELERSDPDLGVFAVQALSAKSWYQVDEVSIERIFAEMIDDVNLGRQTVRDALANAESKVDVLTQR